MAQARMAATESFALRLFECAKVAFSQGWFGTLYQETFIEYWGKILGKQFKLNDQSISEFAAAYSKKIGTEKQNMLCTIGDLYKLAIIVDFLNLDENTRDAPNEIINDIKFTYSITNISELRKKTLTTIQNQLDPRKHGLWKNLGSLATELIKAYEKISPQINKLNKKQSASDDNISNYLDLSRKQEYLNNTAPPIIIKRARSNWALRLGIVSLLCAGAGTTAFLTKTGVITWYFLATTLALSGPVGWAAGGILAFAALCFAGACYYKHTANTQPKNQNKILQETKPEMDFKKSSATSDAIRDLIIQKCNKQNIPVTENKDSKDSSSLVKFKHKEIEYTWSSKNPYDFFYSGGKKQEVGSVLKKLEPEKHYGCTIS